jgi:hypothetical protein
MITASESPDQSQDQSQDQALNLLQAAIAGEKPIVASLVQALLQIEKTTRQQRQQFPEAMLLGDWQLFFATSGKVKLGDRRLRGFYWPSWIPARIGFHLNESDPAPLMITNQITVGLVQIKLFGPAKYRAQKNLLGFDFTQIEVRVLGQVVYSGAFPSPRKQQNFAESTIGQLPFFAFFTVTERCIAARGRGGGLAIWVRSDEKS